MMMRTNIDIDEKALHELMAVTGAKTMKEAVNRAIRDQLKQSRAIDTLRSLRGKVDWEGDIDAMRRDRF
jgi:Arc/MetJ family transcription regulator